MTKLDVSSTAVLTLPMTIFVWLAAAATPAGCR
jgi:hypothetical protein